MTSYQVLLSPGAEAFSPTLDEKSQRIVREKLENPVESPYPGRGRGDKEKLTVDGEKLYRLYIDPTYTAFYLIVEADDEIRVVNYRHRGRTQAVR